MNGEEFQELIKLVRESRIKPPENIFAGGFDDWHVRARLAHFLALPELAKENEAMELFHSVIDAPVDEENAEEVEEKVFALQKLSFMERNLEGKEEAALRHINKAIELAESTDFLYKYILRGELWADRWNILHLLQRTEEATSEVDSRLEAYSTVPDIHNSYVYYGYRFKAHLAAEAGRGDLAKDYMRLALKAMDVPEENKKPLESALSATHDNTAYILNEIDRATPNPDLIHWDI